MNNYKNIFTIDTIIIQLNHERKKIYEIVIKGAIINILILIHLNSVNWESRKSNK
jgi:hypothetical protein